MEYILHLISRTFLWYAKATEHCVCLHAQSRQSWDHCDQLHERHDTHRRVHCAVQSTLRTVFRCVDLMRSYVTLAQVSSVCLHFHPWSSACAFVLECSLHPSLYFFHKSFFHLFLNPAMVPDENSMKDPLCNSSFGSMVSLDYVTPDTKSLPIIVQRWSRLLSNVFLSSRSILSSSLSSLFSSLLRCSVCVAVF